jgi:hypothetical protein
MQDQCMVCAEHTIEPESFCMQPIELLGDVGHVEPRFVPFGDGVSVGARLVHGLHQTYHRLRNHFGRTGWNSFVMWVMWNLISVCLEMVLVPVQDRRMVCTKQRLRNHFGRTQCNS